MEERAITTVMSYLDAAARVTQIRTMFEQVTQPAGTQSSSGFGQALQQASATQAASATQSTGAVAPTGETAGLRALDAARSQLGVTEQPPGSNDGPDIARYRGAVTGAYADPSTALILAVPAIVALVLLVIAVRTAGREEQRSSDTGADIP